MKIGIITKPDLPDDYRYFKKILLLYTTNKDTLLYKEGNSLAEKFVNDYPIYTKEFSTATEIKNNSDMIINFTEMYHESNVPVVFV